MKKEKWAWNEIKERKVGEGENAKERKKKRMKFR